MSTLGKFRRNVHSQNGEDGVLAEIFRRLDVSNGWFVEFGAWDGKHLSNTYRLLENGWQGVYIEGDEAKHRDLVRNMEPFGDKVQPLCAYVRSKGSDSLDRLLSQTRLPKEFQLLSIDIDSQDWHVWHGLKEYAPLVVVIEINSNIPVGIYQTDRGELGSGSSFTATVDLGKRKGYTPVCHTGNIVFVRDDQVAKLGLPEEELEFPELLFDYGWLNFRFDNPYPFPLGRVADAARGLRRLMRRRR